MAVETRSDRIIAGRLFHTQEFGALIRLLEGPLQEKFTGELKSAKTTEETAKAVYQWQAYHEILRWIKEAVETGERSAE